jgi:predicted RNA binding protein YcfA (HicA-like mRNA interferase family)
MTQRDKLIEKIRRRPVEADISDVCTLLEMYGWTQRQGGKHTYIFVKQGERSITIPTLSGRKVKRPYLTQICERLGLDE